MPPSNKMSFSVSDVFVNETEPYDDYDAYEYTLPSASGTDYVPELQLPGKIFLKELWKSKIVQRK